MSERKRAEEDCVKKIREYLREYTVSWCENGSKLADVLTPDSCNNIKPGLDEIDTIVDDLAEIILQFSKEESGRFCKRHGYVSCECPEDMGLSMAEYKELVRAKEESEQYKIYADAMEKELRRQLEDLRLGYNKKAKVIGEQADRISELEAENAELKKNTVSVEAFDMANNGFHNGVKEIKRLEAELAEARKEVAILKGELGKDGKVPELVNDHFKVKELQAQVDQLTKENEKAINDLQEKCNDYQFELGTLPEAVQAIIYNLTATNWACDDLQKELEAKDSHLKKAVEALTRISHGDVGDGGYDPVYCPFAKRALEEIRGKSV